MRGDPVGARLRRELRRAHGIGMAPAPGVADGGDVVDVDAEAKRALARSHWPTRR